MPSDVTTKGTSARIVENRAGIRERSGRVMRSARNATSPEKLLAKEEGKEARPDGGEPDDAPITSEISDHMEHHHRAGRSENRASHK